MIRRFNQHKGFVLFKLGFYVAVPLALLLLPADYFDNGRTTCLSQLLFDLECYACGLTRASMHLIHFELEEALYYNRLVFVVMPLVAGLWAWWFWTDWKRLRALSAPKN